MKADHKNSYGTCRPYTRHLISCDHRTDADYNACACPKWLYLRKSGEQPRRYSLSTPSWAEAQEIAIRTLEELNPVVAAAREKVEEKQRRLMSVKDASELWLQRCLRQHGRIYAQYQTVANMLRRWAGDHGIEDVQSISALGLEKWYGGHEWLALAETTRRQRWIDLRSLFSYLRDCGIVTENPAAKVKPIRPTRDHRQGPYSDQQVDAILAHVGDNLPDAIEPTTYIQRLRTFIELLLNTGCDVVDAVRHTGDRIEDLVVDGETVSVYRYKRTKTRVAAVIPLPAAVAAALRSIPRFPENPTDLPFRDPRVDLVSDRAAWSRRVKRVLKAAGVEWVLLSGTDDNGRPRRKEANSKQFRHTFAVRQLCAGQRPEEVARELGHSGTDLIYRHYAPWIKDMDMAHIARIVRTRP